MLARDMRGWNIWTVTVVWYKQYVTTTIIKRYSSHARLIKL
jgi:hypothetical protein